jgi:predicted permease
VNFNFHERFVAELERTAGASGASPVAVPPFLGSNVWLTRLVPEGQPEPDAAKSPWFGLDLVGPEYFRTLDLPILRGRGFTDGDREGTARIAVISEGVARALWPDQDVIGKRFHFPQQDSPDSLLTIVGLTRDLHFREYREPTPMVFRPFRQSFAQGYFVARTHAPLADELPSIRRALRDAEPRSTLVAATTLDELIAPELERPRFNALLLSLFALAALLIAGIGLYGIMASAVTQQRRELGVRMALGATKEQVRGLILRQALAIAALGGMCGLVGAGVGARLVESLLFEVRPADPVTLVGVSLLLLGVALLAAYLPARRATKIDPAVALRAE